MPRAMSTSACTTEGRQRARPEMSTGGVYLKFYSKTAAVVYLDHDCSGPRSFGFWGTVREHDCKAATWHVLQHQRVQRAAGPTATYRTQMPTQRHAFRGDAVNDALPVTP
jgi:hypothetical protein